MGTVLPIGGTVRRVDRTNVVKDRTEAFGRYLREETTGGKLLLLATAVALLWANLATGSYRRVWDADLNLGPEWLHLHLSAGDWVADGLLAVFFFVAGLEVKREFVTGELSDRRAAVLPFAAALGGMALPAIVSLVVSRGAAAEGGAWAIPVATDIAFALGVLALAGSALPTGVRVLLLSMAVIDDLGAIALIAALFSDEVRLSWLAGAVALGALYWWLQRNRWNSPWLLVPIAVGTWVCVHATGVHATVAGVALGLLTPVVARAGERESPGEVLEHRLHPVSAGFVVPFFALAAAGITLGAAGEALTDPVAHGVVAGLLVGKTLGIFGAAWLAVRFGVAALPEGVRWGDVFPVAVLGGIGYTVSLLVTRLAFADVGAQERAGAAVLVASTTASVAAVVLLRARTRGRTRPPAGTR
jgi:NhaA family Na+:H+ antiporter